MSLLKVNNLTDLGDDPVVTDGALVGGALPAGSILQVVQSSTTTPVTTNSLTYSDIGLSATITPSSATSKILVFTSVLVDGRRVGTQAGARVKILRDATSILEDLSDGSSFINAASSSGFVIIVARIASQILDSPATTSPLTYKVQGSVVNTSCTAEYQRNNNTSLLTLMEVAG